MTASDQFEVEWIDHERDPACEPNPEYPDGIDVVITIPDHRDYCTVAVPYPAKRCGRYEIKCLICEVTVAVTTAGRPDDPRSVRIPCLRVVH